MLTGLKVSSFTCKCVFYRPEHNAKEGPHGTVDLKVLKCKNTIHQRIELKKQTKKWGHLSSYYVYSCIYGQKNVTNGSLPVF